MIGTCGSKGVGCIRSKSAQFSAGCMTAATRHHVLSLAVGKDTSLFQVPVPPVSPEACQKRCPPVASFLMELRPLERSSSTMWAFNLGADSRP